MSEWHLCEGEGCTYRIKKENPNFPICQYCYLKKVRAMDFPHKSGPFSLTLSENELDDSSKFSNAFREARL